ncbi:MAG: hypothetical protein KJ927_18505, partial [Candidatus Eisenbacteria bacterium]|nr:hypothetical protein [Candidatus Eisenbacteria bacterium]
MSRFDHALRYLAALCLGLAVCLTPAIASVSLPHSNIDWSTVGDNVEFHLRFINADAEPTGPVSGTLTPQEFGVFLPGFGSPRPFDIPPLAPDSFFDVFIEIPLAELPQNPPEANTGDGLDVPCPPGDHWDGNIDVLWNGAGEQGEVDYHAGELMVCPGGGASLIHFRTLTCTSPAGMTWSITGLCPDFNAILVEEDMITPAPNPVPPGWTGYISVTAAAGAAVPDTCCFQVTLFCDGVPGVIDLCAITCDCGTAGSNPDLGAVDWETLPGTDIVQFHLRWDNPSLTETTSMISGTMNSQEFGAFMPDFGPIGQFDVPALAPDSFFDIFFEVALADLPPNPITQGEPPPGGPCPTSDHWDGNVDIAWDGSGGPGQVNYHFGDLTVCAGGGASLIHVAELVCPTDMPWTISGLCQDYSA